MSGVLLSRFFGRLLLELVLQDRPRRLLANLVQARAHAAQHFGRNALILADQAQQQVLRADVGVAHLAGFLNGQFDDALRARRQRRLAEGRPRITRGHALDLADDLRRRCADLSQNLGGQPVLFFCQTQQQVLRAHIVVVEAHGLFLGNL